MKKIQLFAVLTITIIIGLSTFITRPTNAAPNTSVPIGDNSLMQTNGYDSNPTASSKIGAPLGWTPTASTGGETRDGMLLTNVNWRIGGSTTSGVTMGVQVNNFETAPPGGQFTIGWLDIKVDYNVPTATVDDRYRVVYKLAAEVNWHDLQAYSTAQFPAGFATDGPRAFTHVPEPVDGVWTWADVGNLQVRVESQRQGTGEDGLPLGRKIYVYEIWATVYEGVYPGPNTMTLLPPEFQGLGVFGFFYIDVLATSLVQSHGFEVHLTYNTQVLTAFEYFTYTPYLLASPSQIDDANGRVDLAFSSFLGDGAGFTGDNLLARIYFYVDNEARSPINIESSLLSDVFGIRLDHTTTGALYRGPEYLSAVGPFNPANPIGSQWHEIFPTYSLTYTATAWIDNADGFLSASDQLTLVNGTGWTFQYHVDVVTTTIHWTFKDPDVGNAAAESETPMETMPPGSPIGSRWHQIYPVFSRGFTINSWIDNGNGNFDPSDQFDFEYDDNPGVPVNAHLDAVTTDIIVTLKGEPEPPLPEFPLGIGLILAMAPAIPVAYLWRTRTKRRLLK